MSASLLIVDDDKLTRETLASAMEGRYRVATAKDGRDALQMLAEQEFDAVLSDLMMPDIDGLAMLEQIYVLENKPAVIFITGHATVESAVHAMKRGAYDYITKPVNLERLELLLQKALEARDLREENRRLRRRIREHCASGNHLVGQAPQMQKVLEVVRQVAPTDAGVLIEGESGTGKELIANQIHCGSSRAAGPFIKVNCASLAEGVLESELFGHERGAFTGAVATRKGRFELADGGTLFLDEIGDLPTATQLKLLRFLQEHSFERVGGNKTIKVNVRIIAATHRNLTEQVHSETFREDLYYRLRVVRIVVPPLRQRPMDIDPLITHFIGYYNKIHHCNVEGIDEDARRLLSAHTWPGNVRELMHCIESMVVMARGSQITTDDIPDHLLALCDDAPASPESGILAELESKAIKEVLRETGGNKVLAARKLGIGLRTLYRRIDKLRI